MLNHTTANPFTHTVSLDPKVLPAQPAAPQTGGLIRDTWVSTPAPTTPTLIIPGAAPQPQPAGDWFSKLIEYTGLFTPGTGPALIIKKVAPQVAQDVADIASGAWGALQGAWNALFAPRPASPVQAPAPQAPTPVQPDPVAAPLDLRTPEMLADQEASIRRRFQVALKREATPTEVADYMAWFSKGAPIDDIHAAITGLPEAKIVKLFKEEVGRDINADGRAFWLREFNNGESLGRIRDRIRSIVGYGRDKYGMYRGQ